MDHDRREDDPRIAGLEERTQAHSRELERLGRSVEAVPRDVRELLRDHGDAVDELVKHQAARIDETRRSLGGLRDDLRAIRGRTEGCAQGPELEALREELRKVAARIDAAEAERSKNRATVAVAVIAGCATVLAAVCSAVALIVTQT